MGQSMRPGLPAGPRFEERGMDSIIFDVDGTLWDSRASVTRSWNRAVEEVLGVPGTLTARELGRQFGKTMIDIMVDLFPGIPPEQAQALSARCFQVELDRLEEDPGVLFPGVAETLPRLCRRVPLYIVSNCQCGYIDALLRVCGFENYFSGFLCWEDTGLPKSGTLRTLMERYSLKDSVYVGDTQGDADQCALAGIPMIWAAYGFGEVKAPKQTIRRFSDLLSLPELAK